MRVVQEIIGTEVLGLKTLIHKLLLAEKCSFSSIIFVSYLTEKLVDNALAFFHDFDNAILAFYHDLNFTKNISKYYQIPLLEFSKH